MLDDDDEWHEDRFPVGRDLRLMRGMYLGNTFETELPCPADAATYEKYAKLPSWHVEEAASLVAGFRPRRNIQFFPSAGLPSESGAAASPDQDLLTWNKLLHGLVGQILAVYARY